MKYRTFFLGRMIHILQLALATSHVAESVFRKQKHEKIHLYLVSHNLYLQIWKWLEQGERFCTPQNYFNITVHTIFTERNFRIILPSQSLPLNGNLVEFFVKQNFSSLQRCSAKILRKFRKMLDFGNNRNVYGTYGTLPLKTLMYKEKVTLFLGHFVQSQRSYAYSCSVGIICSRYPLILRYQKMC